MTAAIYSHKGQVRRRGVFYLRRLQVFHPDLHAHFHGCPENPVYLRLQEHQFPYVDRMKEGHLVYGGGDDRASCVPDGGDCAA